MKMVYKSGGKQNKRIRKSITSYCKIALLTVVVVVICRVFFFASFRIPSQSMEPTLYNGDYILVNKIILGPRVFTSFDFVNKIQTKRLLGLRNIKRNDILVFNFIYHDDWARIHMNLDDYYVKRCIGLPGETLSIENGIYRIKGTNEHLGNHDNQTILSAISNEDLKRQEGLYYTIPFDTLHDWNIKNFGPLYIPQKNNEILISKYNIGLYKNLIEYETGEDIIIDENLILMNGQVLTKYTFLQNYYFMAGDFILDSKDSRYWGLLPEDHIIGVASIIWKSIDPNTRKYRFNRMFRYIE